jgi:hypothetical protein
VLGGGPRRIEVETTLACLSGLLGVLTLAWHDWVELTGWRPDHRGGAVEWMIVAAFLLAGIVLGIDARTRVGRR